jgi:hypothetical protein
MTTLRMLTPPVAVGHACAEGGALRLGPFDLADDRHCVAGGGRFACLEVLELDLERVGARADREGTSSLYLRAGHAGIRVRELARVASVAVRAGDGDAPSVAALAAVVGLSAVKLVSVPLTTKPTLLGFLHRWDLSGPPCRDFSGPNGGRARHRAWRRVRRSRKPARRDSAAHPAEEAFGELRGLESELDGHRMGRTDHRDI